MEEKQLDKKFTWLPQVGRAKYVVSFYSGTKTHPDGSEFWDIHICRNKQNLARFLRDLRKQGYREV